MSEMVPLYGFGSISGGTLKVTAPAGAIITASKDGTSKTKAAGSDGKAVFRGLASGVWAVTITDGADSSSYVVMIENETEVSVSLNAYCGINPGTGFNFAVAGYVTEAALLADTPGENTIGIITDTAITGWAFSASEPAEPAEGMVWIRIGTSSGAEFNAAKKNTIQVYPLSAKQYVSGTWVDVTAKSYIGGEWTGWFVSEILYSKNVFKTEYAFELTPSNATGTLDDNCVELKTVGSKVSEVYIRLGPYDLTSVSTIKMVCTLAAASTSAGTVYGVVFASQETGASYANAVAIATQNASISQGQGESEQYEVTLDVSDLTGEYYLYCGTHTAGGSWQNVRTFKLYELGCYA